MVSRSCVLLACLLSPLWWNAVLAQSSTVDEVDVRQRLQTAVKTDPILRGAWVKVLRLPSQDKVRLDFIVDSARANQQTTALTRLVQHLIPRGKYEISPTIQQFPVTELIAELQARLDERMTFGGSLIEGAYFERGTGDQLRLGLVGRIRRGDSTMTAADLKDKILNLCSAAMKDDRRWPSATAPNAVLPVSEGIQEIPPSEAAFTLFINNGIQLFLECRYAEAEAAFAHACVESPSQLEYRYWRIVCLIAAGQEDRAYRLLRPLVRQRREGNDFQYAQVARSLERVQGPVRYTLNQLEYRAWLEVNPPSGAP